MFHPHWDIVCHEIIGGPFSQISVRDGTVTMGSQNGDPQQNGSAAESRDPFGGRHRAIPVESRASAS